MSDGTLLEALAGGPAEAPALWTPEDGAALTYGGLAAVVAELAGRLRSFGVERGERVAFALPPGPELVELLLAVSSLGAAAAPLNPAYSEPEYAFYLEDLAPRVLLLPAGELAAARAAASAGTTVVDVTQNPGGAPRLELDGRELADAGGGPAASPDDVALLLHTSGTTSRPKQVPLRHRNLVASARSIRRHYALGPEDVSYCAMPLFHVHGLVASTLAQLFAGGTVVVPRRVAPGRFWRQLVDHGVSWYSASPTFHTMLLERAPEELPAETRLRFVRSCSSALSPEFQARMESYLGVPVLQAYGMTEASHEMASNPLPPARRVPGSVGLGTGSEVAVVAPGGEPLPEGTQGEVVVRGPSVMSGYLANDKANAEAFYGEWFRTGDLGTLDGGYLHLVGRIKEIIDRGGEKVSPMEVEEALLRHPDVAEAVVYGIPDAKYGQVVGSAVVLRGGTGVDALAAHCREQVAAFKVPTVFHVVETIPKTPTGKVQRPRMAAHFGED
ncbi:MAG TPA: AMP-binding protein [Gaiellaceae bacterium]|nr:AMP-binding protein [Gaiellaceae bacterium]